MVSGTDKRYAKRIRGFKEKMRDKQIKPRREEEKESVIPVERKMTEQEKEKFERYGIKPEWMD